MDYFANIVRRAGSGGMLIGVAFLLVAMIIMVANIMYRFFGGVITGTYDNDVEQVFGQVALATFTNPEGLVGLEDNTFAASANSGQAVVVAPQSLGAGRIEAGQLEQSNVDLPREFIGLITASTGFSAAGRVVRTADELLQELLLLVR